MSMLTIRNLDEAIKGKLRIQAAQHGCSMEEEVRRILQRAVSAPSPQKGFGTRIHQRVVAMTGGFDLPLPPRTPPRIVPSFGEDE